jgi:uncharacterized membrane protein
MPHQTSQMKAMLKSWGNIFLAALITAFLVVIVETKTLALNWETLEAVLIAGLVAVLPVIKNYLDSSDHRYGRGYEEE